jgi:hypothetical protein
MVVVATRLVIHAREPAGHEGKTSPRGDRREHSGDDLPDQDAAKRPIANAASV